MALGMALLLATGCSEPPQQKAQPPREVEVQKLAASEVRETSEYLGTLLSRTSVNVLPQVSGYVRKIHVKPGDKVQAGQPLVEIDARKEAAALDSASAQMRSAKTNLELAQQTLTRSESLFKEGLISAQELDQARAQAQAAEAALKAAQAQVSQRSVELQFYTVRAPLAGTVGEVLVRLGDFVGATTNLTTLAQADMLEVNVGVPAERARLIQPGTVLEILDSNGEVLVSTEVFYVAPVANPRTQLVDVKGVFKNDAKLRPSEMVRVRIVFGTRQAIQIPALSVVRQSGRAFVFKVKEQEGKTVVERHPIVLGTLGPTSYVVEEGLSEGDAIAVSSIQALRDGAPIVPKTALAAEKTVEPTGDKQP